MKWILLLFTFLVTLYTSLAQKEQTPRMRKPYRKSRNSIQFIEDSDYEEHTRPAKINNGDESTVTFQLFDVDEEEMATYIKCRFTSEPDEEKVMLLDLSSYMTVLFHKENIDYTTQITYRNKSKPYISW